MVSIVGRWRKHWGAIYEACVLTSTLYTLPSTLKVRDTQKKIPMTSLVTLPGSYNSWAINDGEWW